MRDGGADLARGGTGRNAPADDAAVLGDHRTGLRVAALPAELLGAAAQAFAEEPRGERAPGDRVVRGVVGQPQVDGVAVERIREFVHRRLDGERGRALERRPHVPGSLDVVADQAGPAAERLEPVEPGCDDGGGAGEQVVLRGLLVDVVDQGVELAVGVGVGAEPHAVARFGPEAGLVERFLARQHQLDRAAELPHGERDRRGVRLLRVLLPEPETAGACPKTCPNNTAPNTRVM